MPAAEVRRAAKLPTPRTGLAEWAARYVPSYFSAPASGLHRWLVPELEALGGRRGSRLNVVAPRGAAKSTWVSFAYPLWAAVEEREPYILLLSDTGDQAKKYLEALKRELEDNPLLARDYPAAVGEGPVWQQGRVRLRNGVEVEALGTGAKVRGRKNRNRRPTLVIVDDPQNNQHMNSPTQRVRSWEWLTREVLEVGEPGHTNFLAVGTAIHRECIVLRLLETAGWRSQLFRAVVRWPERMDLWREWEGLLHDWHDPDREAKALAFYEGRKGEMDAGAELLWPEREPLYALMLKRAEIGPAAFESEKQSSPVNPESCEWPAEYFDWPGLWFDEWPERLVIKTLALDPSKGSDSRPGDYSAFVRYGRDREGVEYVEADVRRRDVAALAADAVEHVRTFRPDGFALETNAWQDLLCVPMEQAATAAGIHLPIYGIHNSAPKQVRIRQHTTYLSRRKVRFKNKSPGTALLVQQLRDFPVGDHDDAPDAWQLARHLAVELWNGGRGG